VGQYRIPFGIETQTSSRKLHFINRMLVTSPHTEQASSALVTSVKTGYLQERDIGLRLTGKPLSGPIGLDYSVAIINGSDRNTTDRNDKKDWVGRVGLSPLKMLTIGGSAYLGKSPQTVTAAGVTTFTGLNVKRNRYGVDLEIQPVGPMLIRAEYITGKDHTVTFKGYYAFVAYRLPMDIEPLARIERLDPDNSASNNEITRTTVGVNYYIKGETKIQANYEFRDDKAAPRIGNMALVQLQLGF
jgi:phosphate-selective porin